MNYILIALLCFLASIQFSQSQYGDYGGYGDGFSGFGGDEVTSCNRDFVTLFLRQFCQNVAGDYDTCRKCVYVGCLRYMDDPTRTRQYSDCIADHNRCCNRNGGVNTENVGVAAECYATGWISEVVGGQLSVIQTAVGMQSRHAPESFTDRHYTN